jgi:hypothetical protein
MHRCVGIFAAYGRFRLRLMLFDLVGTEWTASRGVCTLQLS